MCVEKWIRAPFYSKASGSQIAMRINGIKNYVEVENPRENK